MLQLREPKKRAIPVALKRIPFDNSIDLKGLGRLQVFRDSHDKAFQQRSTGKTREDFAEELFPEKILKIVKRYGITGRNDGQDLNAERETP